MRTYFVGATVVLLLTGCGAATGGKTGTGIGATTLSPTAATLSTTSSPPSRPTPPSTSGEAALRPAVQAYSDAFLSGNAKRAYSLLSTRCQERSTLAEFTAITDQAKALYGNPLPMKSFNAQISGDLARVTYTYAVSAINQTREPWVRESGRWHEDDC